MKRVFRFQVWPTVESGFTLLEVMIAVAVLAIALVPLLGSQTRSIPVISEARFITTASMLGREKLTELALLSCDEVYDDSGVFDDTFPSFTWESKVRTLTEEETGFSGVDDLLKTLSLTVALEDGSASLTLQTILIKDIVADEAEE